MNDPIMNEFDQQHPYPKLPETYEEHDNQDLAGTLKKMKEEGKHQEMITYLIKHLERMISMMDFCFERLFNKKDKEFMIAYHQHIKSIHADIQKLSGNTDD